MPLLPALALNPTVAALSAGAALAYAVLAWAHQRLNAAQVRSVRWYRGPGPGVLRAVHAAELLSEPRQALAIR